MAKIKGVCKNIDDCSKAEHKEIQELEKSAQFVCEECGKPLTEMKGGNKGGSGSKTPIIIIVVLLILGLSAGGYFLLSGSEGEETVVVDKPEGIEEPEVTLPASPAGSAPLVVIEQGDQASGTGTGTISFEYGKYSGAIKNHKANGQGTLLFYKTYRLSQFDKQERMAESKDYVSGEFKDNELINGKWFDKNNNQKGVVLTGQVGVPTK